MFKSKSSYPLHLAVRHHREDVVFLFLIEFNSQVGLSPHWLFRLPYFSLAFHSLLRWKMITLRILAVSLIHFSWKNVHFELGSERANLEHSQLPDKLNEVEPSSGQVPLLIALREEQESIARTLVGHNCDANMADVDGQCLLHKAIRRGDEFAATFLIQNGARVSAATHSEHETPLHLAASYRWAPLLPQDSKGSGGGGGGGGRGYHGNPLFWVSGYHTKWRRPVQFS